MERFSEITAGCAGFMINALNEAYRVNMGDGSNASTVFVKNAQAFQLGKVVTAVGIFSIFEARLQDGLDCSDGFAGLRKLLSGETDNNLVLRFQHFVAAVNVLKHGRGRSYDWLLERPEPLPFRLRARDQAFFLEGDVSEPDTLVLVDDLFVSDCVKLVESLIERVQQLRPEVYFA